MAVSMEGLEFQIEVAGEQGARGLDELRESLSRLKAVTRGGVGLGSTVRQMERLRTALSGMDLGRISEIGNALTTLGNARVTGESANGIRRINRAISEIDMEHVYRLQALVRELRDLSEVGNVRVPTVRVPRNGIVQEAATGGDAGAGVPANSEERSVEQTTERASALQRVLSGVSATFRVVGAAARYALWEPIKLMGRLTFSALGTLTGFRSIRGMLQSLGAVAKKASGKFNHLVTALGRIAMYRAVRFILSSITKALREGINNLYEYSKAMGGEFARSMNSLATNALYLKNSFGAMASPLINALAPAIDYVTGKIVSLLNMINMLIARLSGKSFFTAAKKTATTYKGVGDAASGAAKKLKSYTSGLDELNIIEKDNGSGGGSGAGGLNYSDMFEEVPIENSISDFADKLKQAFEASDWEGLGTLIGEKINGLFDPMTWYWIGLEMGNGLNGILQTLYHTLDTIDFTEMGQSLAYGLSGMIGSVDWEYLGRLLVKKTTWLIDLIIGGIEVMDWNAFGKGISDLVVGMLNEVTEWLGSHDWAEVGRTVWEAIVEICEGIDWAAVVQALITALGGLIAAGSAFLSGFFEDLFTDVMDYFTPFIEQCGGDIIAGLWAGIKEAFKNAWTWIKTNIVDPFVEAFCDLFGIESPSKVMSELGEYIVEGLKNGLLTFVSLFPTITEWAGSVVEWFTKGKDGKGIVENFKTLGRNIIDGFKNKVFTTYTTVKTNITTWASKVVDWFTNDDDGTTLVDKFKSAAGNLITGFIDGIGEAYGNCKATIKGWGESVIGWFKDVLGIHSPSRVFRQMAEYTVSGYNLGFKAAGKSTKGVVDAWTDSFASVNPVMRFAVDPSALDYYNTDSFAKSVSANVSSRTSIMADGFNEGMDAFFGERIEPMMTQMAEDMRRQADKSEKVVVQIGNRTVTDAVTTQRSINGFAFAK